MPKGVGDHKLVSRLVQSRLCSPIQERRSTGVLQSLNYQSDYKQQQDTPEDLKEENQAEVAPALLEGMSPMFTSYI